MVLASRKTEGPLANQKLAKLYVKQPRATVAVWLPKFDMLTAIQKSKYGKYQ